jgi:DNA-binding transcriptional LysR family regulator
MHRITIKQLAVFTAVAKESSVTSAANRLGLSQAAVSQALSDIEHLLSRRLFDRVGRRLVLNSAGKALLPQAMDILERIIAIESPENTLPFYLRLGASLTVGNQQLVPIMSQFLLEKPQGHIHVDIGNSEHISRALLRFDLDAGFIEGKNYYGELLATPWQEDQLVIIATPTHPLCKSIPTPEKLAEVDWVLRERGSGTREIFEQAILPYFKVNRIRLELTGNQGINQAVLRGVGISCVSSVTVAAELAAGQLVALPVPWLNLSRTLSIVVNKQKHLSRPLLAFLHQCGLSTETLVLQISQHKQE